MKNKLIVVVSALLISCGVVAQKEEMKTLKRIYDKESLTEKDVADYKAAVAKLEPYIASANEGDKVYMNYMRVQVPTLEFNAVMEKPENRANMQMYAMKTFTLANLSMMAEAYNAVLEYEKKTGKKVYTKDIEEERTTLMPMLQQYATVLGNQKNYKDGAKVLYTMYQFDPSRQDMLYNAANFAVAAEDYDNALMYYNDLKKVNYSGEGTAYIAKNLASGNDDSFATKEERDKMITIKTHISPREEKMPSKRGEIYKNIALILVQKGKVDEAKAAIAEAKRENPNDTSLLMTEADLYLSLKDTETYKKLISQVLEKNPNDADLVYNLGVINMQSNNFAEAETYFNRALQINPNYTNAYINISALKLKADQKLVDEMNSLGTSEKDNKRYEVLKKQREALFRGALDPLEKAYALDPSNDLVTDNLLSVYNFLGMKEKYAALKAKK